MNKSMLNFAAALAAAQAVPLALAMPAQAAPSVAGIDPIGNKMLCDRLAEAMVPTEIVPLQADTMVAGVFGTMASQDPGFARMERSYPGMVEAVTAALRPVIVKHVMAVMGPYRADLSQLFCGEMTAGELSDTIAFLNSPDGKAMLGMVNSRITYSNTTKAAMHDGDVTADDVDADRRDAARRAVVEMTPATRDRIIIFVRSPAGRKLVSLREKKSAIEQKWFLSDDPAMEREISDATVQAIIGHIAKTDPAVASRMQKELDRRNAEKAPKRN